MVAIRTDVIDPLDAAFSLDTVSDTEWVGRVVAAMNPLFDEGRGTFAWLVRRNPGGPDTLESLVHADGPDDLMYSIGAMHQDASPEDYATVYPNRDGLYTLGGLYGARRFYESRLLKRWVHDRGMIDAGAIHVSLGKSMLLVGSFLRKAATLPLPVQRFGDRLGRRIAQAHRLRRAIADESATLSAIFTPDGRVAHAEGRGGNRATRERLRAAVQRREKARSSLRCREPAQALELFEGLIDGRFTIVDRFDADGRRYLVAFENPPEIAALRAFTARETEILRRAIDGEPLKRIAIDLGITSGAASAYLAAARKKAGLRTREEMVRWFRHLTRQPSSSATSSAREPTPSLR